MRSLHPNQQALCVFADSQRAAGRLWLDVPGRAVVLTQPFGHEYQGLPAVMLLLCADWRAQDPTIGAENGRLVLRPQELLVPESDLQDPKEDPEEVATLKPWYLYVYSYDPSWTPRLDAALAAVVADYPTIDPMSPYGASMVGAYAMRHLLAAPDNHTTLVSACVARDAAPEEYEGRDWNEATWKRSYRQTLGISGDAWDAWEWKRKEWQDDENNLNDPPSLSEIIETEVIKARRGHGEA